MAPVVCCQYNFPLVAKKKSRAGQYQRSDLLIWQDHTFQMDLKEQEILGPNIDTHWYYVAKGRAIRSLLSDTKVEEVLDVGAGSGIFARQLLSAGMCRRAVCVDPGYAEERAELIDGRKISFVPSVSNAPQKLILMIDVLEHVADDVGLLRDYTCDMPEDGRVVIAVPAFQSLWSGHDVFLEHYRRYSIKTLERTIKSANLRIVDLRYFFGLLFPFMAIVRWSARAMSKRASMAPKSSLRKYPKLLNSALISVHDFERFTLFQFNRVAGLTLFCLAAPASRPGK